MERVPGAMPPARFWEIVETTQSPGWLGGGRSGDRADDQRSRIVALRMQLEALSPAELKGFQRTYRCLFEWAFHWDLWAAAMVAQGEMVSEAGFGAFRDWLISRGQRAYEAALEDPDNLAAVAKLNACAFEDFGTIAADISARRPRDVGEAPVGGEPRPPQRPDVGEPIPALEGESFEAFLERLGTRFPRLAAEMGRQGAAQAQTRRA